MSSSAAAALRLTSAESDPADEEIEVSIVMPCLNEADTLAVCIQKAHRALAACAARGEIIVADNGSTDGSTAIATALGARVVHVTRKGYGNALKGGIAAARGKYIVMGDADDSYDFLETPKFVEKLRAGHQIAQGCRLPSGGGRIADGAMPPLHRWWGNPMFSALVRRMFWARVHDVYCGLRGFSKELYTSLDLRSSGMEFATEMIIKSSLANVPIAEVPITLHRDGRQTHPPHLKTFRDGWRTLRFFLMYSPRWLFLYPGCAAILLGLAGYGISMPGLTIDGVNFDAHTLLVASLAIIVGYQTVVFAVLAKTFAVQQGLLPPNRRMQTFHRAVTLERGLIAGGAAVVCGLALLSAAVVTWSAAGFGHLDYARTMRIVVPGVTLTALGVQTVFSSFLVNIIRYGGE
jgi:glycosyltransferase involved in cell wall biosynthesis